MSRRWYVWSLLLFVLDVTPARADKSGVDPSRLKLPSGPGSLEGVGENVDLSLNMGLMEYVHRVGLPAGYHGLTPNLDLYYSSGAGTSIVGFGWSMQLPTIERMTSRGLPDYGTDDRFAESGSIELVRLPGTNTYRARYEGGFSRYTWVDAAADGRRGYWIAERPDGRIDYFGADATGATVADAVVEGPDGIFRYHLAESTDPLGHSIEYSYVKDGFTSLLSNVAWVFSAAGPRYQVDLTYGPRVDLIFDGKPGFEVVLTQRLLDIEVSVRGELLRRYALEYEDYAGAGQLSRLTSIYTYGTANDEPLPYASAFGYTATLGAACSGSCPLPYLVDMGSIGVNMQSGEVDLVDINGDSLPDVLDTTSGRHSFFVNNPQANGESVLTAAPVQSTVAGSGSAQLSSVMVHMLDVDGDGLSDMVDGNTGEVLSNRATLDWGERSIADINLPDFSAIADLHFFDYDNDKSIDVMRSDQSTTSYYINNGDGTFQTTPIVGDTLGLGFSADGLRLADMNGDGLLDAVLLGSELLSYRIYLGHGRWGPARAMDNVPAAVDSNYRLVDINGDGFSDIVAYIGNEILYALNRIGQSFDPLVPVTEVTNGSVPERDSTMTVRYADMNGNGSTDILWSTQSGALTYIELFPERPNLLNHLSNGLGKVTEVAYRSAVQYLATVGAWDTRLRMSMTMVEELDEYDTFSAVHKVRRMTYSNPYFDGEEKAFRGFADVEAVSTTADGVEDGTERFHYDVGMTDPYFRGKLLGKATESEGRRLHTVENRYAECALDGVPNTDPPIRFICQTDKLTLVQEGAPQDAWVMLEERYEYDGYGNRTLEANLGTTSIGLQACAPCAGPYSGPCGPRCLGDERYTEMTFIPPGVATGGRWVLRKPSRKSVYGVPGSDVHTEEISYYDGDPFVGLTEGQLDVGLVSRTTAKIAAGSTDVVATTRTRYGPHGNVVEELDPNGHRTTLEYDADGLLLTGETRHLDAAGHPPYAIRIAVTHDPVLELPTQSTGWVRWQDGAPVSPERTTAYGLDQFGRLISVTKPGESTTTPTEEFVYRVGAPVSAVETLQRSASGGPADLRNIECVDGRGKTVARRIATSATQFIVMEHATLNSHGLPWLSRQPYTSTTDDCLEPVPGSVRVEESRYDFTGREIARILPDADAFGGVASQARIDYGVLSIARFDGLDTDPASPFHDTPVIQYFDGLQRIIRIERWQDGNQAPDVTLVAYDELGRLSRMRDSTGAEKVQSYDLLGRVTQVSDPDSGTTTFEYDATDHVVRLRDARGRVTRTSFDELGRELEVWDEAAPEETRVTRTYDRPESCPRGTCGGFPGLPTSVSYPVADGESGYDVWGYDERGRRIYQARTVGTATFELTSTYDAADRQTGLGVVGGPQVVYVLDRAGRALSVPGYIASIAYDERGRLEEVQAQNGVRTVNSYGPTMALDSITTTSPTTELLQSLTYVRDRLGRVVTVEDGAAEPGAPSASATYAYDALGRLTVAVLEPGRSREETITYEYDGPGRLLARRSALGAASPAHLGTYEYGTSPGHPGAPAKVGPTDLRYDEAGNLIQRGPVRFEWNHQSRLIAAWRGNERLFAAGFAADLDRVKKVERGQTTYYLGPDVEVRDGMVILTMRINGQRVVRLETEALAASALSDLAPGGGPDGRITAADALLAHRAGGASNGGSGADVPPWHQALASAARRQSSGAPEVATYWHGDHLGTVSVSTDESAQLRQRSLHYPFGALRHATYHISEEYGFAGLEQDYGTGDLHARARNYSPDMGIWLKPDPKFLAIDGEDLEKSLSAVLSRYAYASDDPANRTDPSGLEDVGSWEALRGSGMPPKALEQMAGALIEDTVTKGQSLLGGQLDFSIHGYQVQLSARAYGLRKILETADATYTVTIGEASASFSNYNTPAASAAVVTMERKSKDKYAIIKSVKVSLITASTGGMVKLKMEAPSWSKHAGKSVSLSPGSPGEVKLGFSKVGIGSISVTVSASNFMRKYKKDRVRDHRKTKSWLPPRG